MSILRSDFLVSLNDLIVACREAAIQHWTAADICGDKGLEQEFRRLSQDRNAAFEELASKVTDLGDVPNAPAHEKELLSSVATRVKAALSEDEMSRLFDDCQAKEAQIIESADAVLQFADDESLQARVRELRDDADQRINELRQRYSSS